MHAVAHDRAVIVALVPHDRERHIVHRPVRRAKDEGADAVLARHRVRVAKLLDQAVVLLLQTHNVDEELEGRCAEAWEAHGGGTMAEAYGGATMDVVIAAFVINDRVLQHLDQRPVGHARSTAANGRATEGHT